MLLPMSNKHVSSNATDNIIDNDMIIFTNTKLSYFFSSYIFKGAIQIRTTYFYICTTITGAKLLLCSFYQNLVLIPNHAATADWQKKQVNILDRRLRQLQAGRLKSCTKLTTDNFFKKACHQISSECTSAFQIPLQQGDPLSFHLQLTPQKQTHISKKQLDILLPFG